MACECGHSEAAELVAWVLLEKRKRDGMDSRLRREKRPGARSLISGSIGACSAVRGESGWFSRSSAWLVAGSTRRRTTLLNMLKVVVRLGVCGPWSSTCLSTKWVDRFVQRSEMLGQGESVVFMLYELALFPMSFACRLAFSRLGLERN